MEEDVKIFVNTDVYLTARDIYRFLTNKDQDLDDLILCHSTRYKLFTTDQSLYEAVGSIGQKRHMNYRKLVKLLEVTRIKSYKQMTKKPRKILKEGRVKEIKSTVRK